MLSLSINNKIRDSRPEMAVSYHTDPPYVYIYIYLLSTKVSAALPCAAKRRARDTVGAKREARYAFHDTLLTPLVQLILPTVAALLYLVLNVNLLKSKR